MILPKVIALVAYSKVFFRTSSIAAPLPYLAMPVNFVFKVKDTVASD